LPATVLIAEDNESNLEVISDYLVRSGYRVVPVRNGSEVLERVKESPPNLILLDIQMPGMHGLEVIRRLRADKQTSDTPIIAMTALAMPGDREMCLQAGANEYMSKPLGLKNMVAMIEKQLRQGGL
jgi:CheY-like chemotaxis protein